jgi:hypothetical protein
MDIPFPFVMAHDYLLTRYLYLRRYQSGTLSVVIPDPN